MDTRNERQKQTHDDKSTLIRFQNSYGCNGGKQKTSLAITIANRMEVSKTVYRGLEKDDGDGDDNDDDGDDDDTDDHDHDDDDHHETITKEAIMYKIILMMMMIIIIIIIIIITSRTPRSPCWFRTQGSVMPTGLLVMASGPHGGVVVQCSATVPSFSSALHGSVTATLSQGHCCTAFGH